MKKRVVTKALKDEFKFAYKAFLSKFDKPSLVVYREINGVDYTNSTNEKRCYGVKLEHRIIKWSFEDRLAFRDLLNIVFLNHYSGCLYYNGVNKYSECDSLCEEIIKQLKKKYYLSQKKF